MGGTHIQGKMGQKFLPYEMVTLGSLLKQFGPDDYFWAVTADSSDSWTRGLGLSTWLFCWNAEFCFGGDTCQQLDIPCREKKPLSAF